MGFYGPAIQVVEEWGERPPAVTAEVIDDTISKINHATGVEA